MSESQDKKPTDVLRTKRLEIVDDDGNVRAVLGTNEEGVTSLSLFDQNATMRASLDASNVTEQTNGLGVFDTNGGLQISMGARAVNANEGGFICHGPNGEPRASIIVNEEGGGLYFDDMNGGDRIGLTMHEKGVGPFLNDTNGTPRTGLSVNEKGGSFYCHDANGESRGSFGAHEDGKVGLGLSAAGRDRHIKLGTGNDGDLYLMFTDDGAPMMGLRLAEENKEFLSDLAFIDKEERAAVVISGGPDPQLRFRDRRHKVRGFFGLGVGGEPRLYVADEEGRPIVRQSAFERVVAERSVVYQSLLYGAVLFAGAVGDACLEPWAFNSKTSGHGLINDVYFLPTAIRTRIEDARSRVDGSKGRDAERDGRRQSTGRR